MAVDTAQERRRFQRWLDDRFPKGVWATSVTLEDGVPTGSSITTGRIMCLETLFVNGSWIRGMVLDPVFPALGEGDELWINPWEVYIKSPLAQDEDRLELWEAEIVLPDGSPLSIRQVFRINTEAAVGERRVVTGARELVTEKWEFSLFPNGLEDQPIDEEVPVG